MADISKCSGDRCSDRFKCYRFMAIDDKLQVYFRKPPFTKDGCKYMIEFDLKKKKGRKVGI